MSLCLSWSGGKDSMMALHELVENSQPPESLLTTFSGEFNRITMHGVREELLDEQARMLGLPVRKVFLPADAAMKTYNKAMHTMYEAAFADGVRSIGFGDIYLEDLKNFRDRQVDKAGLTSCFPIWGRNTKELLTAFVDLGYKTMVVAIDGSKLPVDFGGRIIDREFIKDLPADVDPCGENGEFHTFVIDGPKFTAPVNYIKGDLVKRHYPSPVNKDETISYFFQELLPV